MWKGLSAIESIGIGPRDMEHNASVSQDSMPQYPLASLGKESYGTGTCEMVSFGTLPHRAQDCSLQYTLALDRLTQAPVAQDPLAKDR